MDRRNIDRRERVHGVVIDLFDAEAAGPAPRAHTARQRDGVAWSPGELFTALERSLRDSGFDDVRVTGTVVGLRRRARWCGFELVEQRPGSAVPEAVVKVALFERSLRAVEARLAEESLRLADGMECSVVGRLTTNRAFGELRLVASDVEPGAAVGAVASARDELLQRLRATGAATAQKALVAPPAPRRIGLITGAGAAGGADVRSVLEASPQRFEIRERIVPLTGPDAPAAVARELSALGAGHCEVIVLARGGGARSELTVWDSPDVAEAVARCPVPVWAAIGHATDSTVTDVVANRSFVTPTAAANALVAAVEGVERARRDHVLARRHAERSAALAASARRARVAAVALLAVVVVLVVLLSR